jgi:hypothetical protein
MMPSAIAAMDRPAVGHGEFDDNSHEQQAERGKARGKAEHQQHRKQVT